MAIMGSVGLAILYGFKVNTSVAIVAMVNHTAVKLSVSNDSEANDSVIVSTDVCQFDNVSNVTMTKGKVWQYYVRIKDLHKQDSHSYNCRIEILKKKKKKFNLTFSGWSICLERAYSRHDFILLFLGLYGIFATRWKTGRTLVSQMGDERIGFAQSRRFYIIARRCTCQSLALHSNEIPSRDWWCQ